MSFILCRKRNFDYKKQIVSKTVKVVKKSNATKKIIFFEKILDSLDSEETRPVTRSSKVRTRVARTIGGSRMRENTVDMPRSSHFRNRRDHRYVISIHIACRNVRAFLRGTLSRCWLA